ncbi:hypothetical protein O0544_10380 [Edwardsiella anguillarum]|nr:hypothetical protein [Edwardsiella anguillarum]
MAQNVLAPISARMLAEYPGLSVNLVTGVPAPDLIADGLDLVVRAGDLRTHACSAAPGRHAHGDLRRQRLPAATRNPGESRRAGQL